MTWIKARLSGDAAEDRYWPVGYLVEDEPASDDWIPYAHGEPVPEEYPQLRAVILDTFGLTSFPDLRGHVAAELSAADGHDYLENAGYWRDPGKPNLGAGWLDLLLFGVLAIAAVALCIWLAARPDPALDCPDGWRKVTSPNAVQCFNPDHPRPSVQSSPQPRK